MTKCLLLVTCFAAGAVCQTSISLEKKSRAILDKALADKNPDTRKQAVIALSLAASQQPFLAQLEASLSDKDVEVRLAAIASLEDLNTKGAVSALHKALNDPVPEVSFAAAKALFELNDPAGEQALLSVLRGDTKTSSNFFSKEMRDAMRMMHTPKATFLFALRQGAGLAPIPGLGAGVASLQDLLSDSGVSGRAAAALLLSKDKNKQTLQALRDALWDNDWSVRAAAVHSLALWDDPALEPNISPLLDDPKQAVRLRAAAAYLRLQAIKIKLARPHGARTR